MSESIAHAIRNKDAARPMPKVRSTYDPSFDGPTLEGGCEDKALSVVDHVERLETLADIGALGELLA